MTRMGLTCPACGQDGLDILDFESMMVLRQDRALFTLRCPRCSKAVCMVAAIPKELKDEVRFAANELGAGMGRQG